MVKTIPIPRRKKRMRKKTRKKINVLVSVVIPNVPVV